VLHCPMEIASQMGNLCAGLRRRGVEAAAYNTFHTYLGYQDNVFNMDIFEIEWLFPSVLRNFDLFHFHYAATMLPDFADLPLLSAAGKPMVMHHWGNDVRFHDVAREKNPYVYTGDSPPDEEIRRRLEILSRHIPYAIVQDYEVYPYVAPFYEKVFTLPLALDVAAVRPRYPDERRKVPLLIHAPTNPLFKGTEFIETAIRRLRGEGVRFHYRRIEKMDNREALRLYRMADVIIDQILCGSYGMLAVESMSLGKPVVGFVREDLLPLFPEEPPIVNANPDTICDVLRELIAEPRLRREKGLEGRRYVEKHHDLDTVSGQLLDIYKEIRGKG
jgi:hypothetical protein